MSSVLDQLQQIDDIKTHALEVCINLNAPYIAICYHTDRLIIPFMVFLVKLGIK